MESLKLAGAVLGGIGLFLLAIGMMTDGLKMAAGSALRKLLSDGSKTPLRGIFSGFLMTAIVQSSSAVTVASLGFVNAGLINLRQALGIIYGTNIGTTMTGWLVALVGFQLDVQAFALPMIGVGMLLKLVKQQGRLASFGLALVGFGLFFVGIDVLKTAFESVVQVFDISQFAADGIQGMLIFLLIGIVMTILTQSSSASIALTITAASSDMVGLYAAGAMIVGANIGTTSTAMIASIGATSPAKRVAAAQVIFNLVTASVALIILPVLFYLIAAITETLDVASNPAISLALFHSTFNVLGVLLVYPHNDRLVAFLEKRFCSWEEKESHPRFLDKTIAQTPVLAINAITLEILALCDRIITLYNKAIQPDKFAPKTIDDEAKVIKALSSEVTSFIVSVNSTEQEGGAANHLALLMRVDHYLANCLLSAERLADQLRSRSRPASALLKSETTEFLEQVSEFMRVSRSASCAVGTVFSELFSQLQAEHDKLKASFIEAGTRSKVPVDQMSESIDSLAEAMQLAQQWFKAFTRLHSIQAELEVSVISAQESVSIHNNYPPLPGRQLDTSTEIKP